MSPKAPFPSAAAALLLAAVAAAEGVDLPGTQPADGSGLAGYPPLQDDSREGTFDPPSVCDNCHADYRETGQPIHEPSNSWSGSLMAMAGRDPLFWAALDVANQDDALLGDVGVGDFCLRCHAPVAWWEGRSDCVTAWGEAFDGSCLVGSIDSYGNDFEGLTCHFCHRQYDASAPPAGEFEDASAPLVGNAQVYLTTLPNTMMGPYADAEPRRHEFLHSPFHRGAAFCGQCHDVTNPALERLDSETGASTGRPMAVERTYTEWLASAYADESDPAAADCLACHAPPPDLDGDGDGDPAYAVQQGPQLRGDDDAEGDFRPHFLAGGGAWMQQVLGAELGEALGRTEELAAGRAASLELLTQRTAELELTAPASVEAGEDFDLELKVINLAGHALPTGYPEGRRAWLHVAAGPDADGDGELDPGERVFESGAWNPATGELAPSPPPRLYQVELGIFDWNGTGECDHVDDSTGATMHHFVLNDCVVSNTRIPPLGFVPDADTAPVGRTYPENPARPGTLANWDLVEHDVAVPADAAGPVLVEAELLYQTTSDEYVEFLRDESDWTCDPFDADCNPTMPDARPNRGEKMFALWQAHGRAAPVVLASARAEVQLIAGPATGACCFDASCSVLTESACDAAGGSWAGAGSTCESACDCAAAGDLFPDGAGDGLVDLADFVLGHAKLAGVVPTAGRDALCGDLHPGAVTCAEAPQPESWCVTGDGDFDADDLGVLRALVGGVLAEGCATCSGTGLPGSLRRPADVAPRGATDDAVNVGDVLLILRWAVGLDLPLSDEELLRADVAPTEAGDGFLVVVGNGALDVGDVLQALRASVQLDDLRWPLRGLAARVTEESSAAAWSALSTGWPRWAVPAGFDSSACELSTGGEDAVPGRRALTCVAEGAPLATPADLGVFLYRAPEAVSPGALGLEVVTANAQSDLDEPSAALQPR